MGKESKKITIYPTQFRGLPDLHLTDKQLVLGIPIDPKDFPNYNELEKLKGKTICGEEVDIGEYAGGDGVRYNLRVPGIGIAHKEVMFPRSVICGYGNSEAEAAKNAIAILIELPVENKEQYGEKFEFTLRDWIGGPSEFEKEFKDRLIEAKGKLEVEI